MTPPVAGVLCGLVFGLLTVAAMAPMPFPDKRVALTAAFIERMAIGAVIGCVQLSWPGWAIGLAAGLLLSMPSALLTKAHKPILILGSIGGLVIGGIVHGWA